jgi:hypothetical protein
VNTSARIALIVGIVMMLMGAYIALHPLWAGPRPLSPSRLLDLVFAAFFLLRGWMNVRSALNRPRGGPLDHLRRP